MIWFKNMKIRTKMLFSFMLIIALILAMVVLAVSSIRKVGVDYDTVIRHPLSLRSTLLEFQSEYRNLRRIGATIAIYADTGDEGYKELDGPARETYARALRILDVMGGIISGNPELTQAEKDVRLRNNNILRERFIRYNDEVTEPIIAATNASDRAALLKILGLADEIASDAALTIIDMLAQASEAADMQVNRAWTNARSTIYVMILISVVAVAIAVFISFYVSNQISRPLEPLTRFMNNVALHGDIGFAPGDAAAIQQFARNRDETGQLIAAAAGFVRRIMEVGRALETVSDGDLTHSLPLLSERDTMGLAFEKMLRNLNAMCSDINLSSIQVATGASQVSASAETLSTGATEQAASIEELSVSFGQVADRVKATAEMAGQAADLAGTIRASAEQSNMQMGEMMKAVTEISEASQSIRKIIKTIDEIAFQTNILAVNAAVEAAHAGKYGKGFSVVASEVRSLAAKSAEAAKDTERLIANSMEKAGLGVLIAGETATSLSEIVTGIKDNSKLVSEIARSAGEQSGNIEQINVGVNQVSRVVQQNSATAEESAVASEEMAAQSVMLQKLVAQFKLREDQVYHLPELVAPSSRLEAPEYAQYDQD